jgi:hypothetical protein
VAFRRSLGEAECAAFELGLPPTVVKALQQVAVDQLTLTAKLSASARRSTPSAAPARCSAVLPGPIETKGRK